MSEKLQGNLENKPGKEILHPGDFNELGSLDPNVDQNLMRLSGTV
ncbi:MAG: hypothetical protein K0R55_903 [Sporomusa sp.]|jgi:hypothetical protein|nr:hypothetical protein [Sporomusa sp.]